VKRLLLVALVLLVLAGVALVGARLYLSSDSARREVVGRLEAAYGGPVEVDESSVGLFGETSLRGLRLYEAGAEPGAEPWARVEVAQADVSALDAALGTAEPHRITLAGAAVTLRFDRDGKLLSRLPQTTSSGRPLPTIRVERGKVTLQQVGRPEMVVAGVSLELRPDDGKFALSGMVTDEYWGDWTLDGSADPASGGFTATLKTDRAAVTQERLDRLPFVPPEVWEQVKASGPTPVTFTYRRSPDEKADHYRVELDPEGASIHVTSIALRAEDVRGKVTVEDDVVTLSGVRGRALGGGLNVEGELDFRGDEDRLQFTVRAEGLEVQQVPKEWEFPEVLRKVSGRLGGEAKLTVLIGKEVTTSGEGEGVITDARIVGLPADPIRLRLHPTGKGFRFNQGGRVRAPGERETQAVVALSTLTLPPPDEGGVPLARQATRLTQRAIQRVTKEVIDGGRKAVAALPKGPPDPNKAPTYLDVNLGMKDVDLEQLLTGIGIKLPFPASGRLTFQVQATLPVDAARDVKLYRAKGTVTLKQLVLAGTELEQVDAQLDLANGVLTLKELRATFPPTEKGQPGGSFTGTARLGLAPAGDLTGNLTLDRVPLGQVLRPVPGLKGQAQGVVSGSAELRVPAGKLQDMAAWRGSGRITADGLKVEGVQVGRLNFDWDIAGDRLRLTGVRAALYGGEATGSAAVPLADKQTGDVKVNFTGVDVGALVKDVPAVPLKLEGKAGGKVEGTITAAAAGKPREFNATVDLSADRLRVQDFVTEKLTGTVTYRDGAAEYRLKGSVFGGTFDLDGRVPPRKEAAPEKEPQGRLRVEGAQLARIWDDLGLRESLGPLQGTIDLQVDFDLAEPDRLPSGSGLVVLSRLRWGDAEIAGSLRGDVRLAGYELRLRDLTGTLGEGTLRGQVGLNLRDTRRSWFNLALDGVDAARLLLPWPGAADAVQGTVDARLRGTLGPEWRGGGDVVLTRGRVFGAEVTEWRAPVSFTFAPSQRRGQIDVPETAAQVARGRVSGRASLGFGTGTRLEGHLQFYGLDLQALLRQAGDLSQVGAGRVSGRIDFGGSDVRSLADVTAVVDASFRQTQAFQLPVLEQVARYVSLTGDTTFQSGELRGRLSGGLFRLQRLSLSGAMVSLFAEGVVTTEGRLNLNVTAATNRLGINPRVLRLIGLRIPAIGPVPVALIVEVTDYLSNRVVHLRVTGTVRSPTVRVEALPLLTDEAVRYFVNRYGVPLP
jgi:hypothetical protein